MAAPWMLLGRVLRLAPGPDPEVAEAELAAAAADDDDFSVQVDVPPCVTVVTANPSAHPEPEFPDRYPYVLVANPIGLLVNFSAQPFYGVQFNVYPLDAHLVLVHEFHQAEDEAEEAGVVMTATAHRLPPRQGFDPIIYNLDSIGMGTGMVTLEDAATEEIIISELMVTTGSEDARIVYCFAGGSHNDNLWLEEVRDYPLAAHDRDWVPSGVLFHDDRLWWFDLSWGILSCEVSPDEMGLLIFHDLPEGRALDASRPGIHHHRCIAASGGALRYVEIIPDEDAAAATVSMWTAVPVLNDDDDGQVSIVWGMAYEMGFAEIWNDDSYVVTGLPPRVPVITAVCPSNPDLVYFSLEQEQRLFGVDVPQHRVVEFVDEAYDLVMPWPVPPSSRYVLAWVLQQQVDADSEQDSTDDPATGNSSA